MDETRESHLTCCDTCIHNTVCGWFELYDDKLSDEENFIRHCCGCCCGDGSRCNRWNGTGIFCSNWEDKSEPLMG